MKSSLHCQLHLVKKVYLANILTRCSSPPRIMLRRTIASSLKVDNIIIMHLITLEYGIRLIIVMLHEYIPAAFLSQPKFSWRWCRYSRGIPSSEDHTSRASPREDVGIIWTTNEGDLPCLQQVPQVHCRLPSTGERENTERRIRVHQRKVRL